MTKKEAWEMFKKTGEIEYYLMYKRLYPKENQPSEQKDD